MVRHERSDRVALLERAAASPKLIRTGISLGLNPAGTPGYSTTNFILLQEIAEEVTGKPLAELIAASATGPLNLAHTYLPRNADTALPDPVADSRVTLVCQRDFASSGGTVALGTDLTAWNASYGQGGGGMTSTITDLRTWATSETGTTLLPAALAKQRLHFSPIGNGEDYGLGIFTIGDWIGHEGEALGWESIALHNPKTGVSIAFAANSCGVGPLFCPGTPGALSRHVQNPSTLRALFISMRRSVSEYGHRSLYQENGSHHNLHSFSERGPMLYDRLLSIPRQPLDSRLRTLALSQDLDRASRAGRPLKPLVAGDKRNVGRFGEGHIAGIVDRHVIAQLLAAVQQGTMWSAPHRKGSEIIQCQPGTSGIQMPGGQLSPPHRRDFEIDQRGSHQSLAAQSGACPVTLGAVIAKRRCENAGVTTINEGRGPRAKL